MTSVHRRKITSGGFFVLLAFLFSTGAGAARMPQAEAKITICADDLVPKNMAITATGDSPDCAGSCTARTIEVVKAATMVICAHQPIPEGYTLDAITTAPQCDCIGAADNAYVVKKNRASEEE